MSRHIFLIPGVDAGAMHERARKLVDSQLETTVGVHAHPYIVSGQCNEGCVTYAGKAPINAEATS